MTEYGFVYMMYERKDDVRPDYVGFTSNPWQRLSSHFKDGASGNGKLRKDAYKIVRYVKIAHVGNELMARALEAKLIDKYRPVFNTAYGDAMSYRNYKDIDENDFNWCWFTKQEFMHDKSVVFRCLEKNDAATKSINDAKKLQEEITLLKERLIFVDNLYTAEKKSHDETFKYYLDSNKYYLDAMKWIVECKRRIPRFILAIAGLV